MVRRFRDLPPGRKARLEAAQELANDDALVGGLAQCLASSIAAFDTAYGATAEPFHPARTVQPGERLTLDRADNLGLRLSGLWLVENDDRLDFVFLDREVPVAHRHAHPRIDDDVTADLLLANAHDGTPIVGEVKMTHPEKPMNADADPYYALMQSLAAVSMLATPSQLKRLRERGRSEYPVATTGPVDVYVFALNPTEGTYMDELSQTVSAIARKLLGRPETGGVLRRIALLDVSETPKRCLRIVSRWAHDAPA